MTELSAFLLAILACIIAGALFSWVTGISMPLAIAIVVGAFIAMAYFITHMI